MLTRLLGLDYGRQYIGIAISNSDHTIAFPRAVWKGKSKEQISGELNQLIREEGVVEIVVGWPLSMTGKPTPQTTETAEFIEWLKEKTFLPVAKIDERWSSIQAKKLGGDHSVAAQILLQTYLEMKK
ncbi:MAG: hypothetical protein ACD_28C00236G0003 [uncultured bacterium]|nr:MAG: hypothetical protein ACD_28C00236G0003 [uncultured bacterium]KKT73595.1 MAG: Holliday junction resolvase [Candidatus Peregrinibacteria bacterium GW2011_GWA2_44_7]